MNLLTLSEETIRKVLLEAFEAGWYGCLELKEGYVEETMEKLSNLSSSSSSNSYSVITAASSIFIDPGHFIVG